MTLERLEQHRDQLNELKLLEEKEAALGRKVILDSVHGSDPDFSHTKRVYRLEGKDDSLAAGRRAAVITRRRERLELECAEIEEWIETLADSKLRQIIDLRYIQGLPWRRVAKRAYGASVYEDVARKYVKRFFEINL